MDIAEKLKTLRNDYGYTAKQVATVIGVSRSAYSNYEQNIRQPDYDTLVKIAKLYEITTDYLLGMEDEFGNKIKPTETIDLLMAAQGGGVKKVTVDRETYDRIEKELDENADKPDEMPG